MKARRPAKDTGNIIDTLLVVVAVTIALFVLFSEASGQYDSFVQERSYGSFVEDSYEAFKAEPQYVPEDGWYAIEALTCVTCDTARPELAALVKAGWKIKVVDETSDFAKWAKPSSVPTIMYVREGRITHQFDWPYDRWDLGRVYGYERPRPKPQPEVYSQQYVEVKQPVAYMYMPSGSSVWSESGGGTSFQHLVGHGYDPSILRNTPPQYYGMLHGDAHEGRRSRVVPVNASTPAQYTYRQQYRQPLYRAG